MNPKVAIIQSEELTAAKVRKAQQKVISAQWKALQVENDIF